MQSTTIRAVASLVLISCGAGRLTAQEHEHPPGQPTAASAPTPLYDDLGTFHRTISTGSELTQEYFDQGLRLTYAFNHDEAIKSFKQAIQHDSTCAMCYWGIAYALGPNINAPLDTSAVAPAYEAVQNALKYRLEASPLERGFI